MGTNIARLQRSSHRGFRDGTCAVAPFEASVGERGGASCGVASGTARLFGPDTSPEPLCGFRPGRPSPPSARRACAAPAGVCVADVDLGSAVFEEGPGLGAGAWVPAEVGQGGCGVRG